MTKKANYVFDDDLYHWGIPGQRWGHRRFQNEDGSWTAEGRERYGKGDDVRTKAKVAYNTQKYKADLKSKAQKEKDIRTANEERNRIKLNSKTSRLARKEQGKFDRLNKKEEARLNNQGRPGGKTFGRTKNMSDDELQNAINRLKLQAEYNKQYALATSPNSALAKADRFFEGPTGKLVSELAIRTLPDITKAVVTKAFEDKPDKLTKELEIAKKQADIQQTLAATRNTMSQAKEREMKINKTYQEQHAAEVKARAEKMFGGNKNDTSQKQQQTSTSTTKSSDDINKDFYSRIEKGVSNAANKAANSLLNTASGEIKKHAETFSNEAKRGVKEGVNEAVKDLLGSSNKTQTKSISSIPTYSEEEMYKILKGLGRI